MSARVLGFAALGVLLVADLALPVRPARAMGIARACAGGSAAIDAARAWGLESHWLGAASRDRQRASDGCGPAALSVLLRRRERQVPQGLLWSVCRVPEGGTTLGRLQRAASAFGVATSIDVVGDFANAEPPLLVHLQRGHFVVLEQRRGSVLDVFDPACGRVRMRAGVLQRAASGAVLRLGASPAAAGDR
jgi:hypothetical protein